LEEVMKNDPRLQPWLELADELERLDRFMLEHDLVPTRAGPGGETEYLDAGASVAKRMYAIAANQWTWFGWKRDGIQGEVRARLHTFHRWIGEGFFFGCEDTEAGREMLARIEYIERKFKQLSDARA
jgi:hypothetical protein